MKKIHTKVKTFLMILVVMLFFSYKDIFFSHQWIHSLLNIADSFLSFLSWCIIIACATDSYTRLPNRQRKILNANIRQILERYIYWVRNSDIVSGNAWKPSTDLALVSHILFLFWIRRFQFSVTKVLQFVHWTAVSSLMANADKFWQV